MKTKKILIVGPSWVGDMVMAQALFITLQEDAKAQELSLSIDVLAPAWSRPLLERMPQINEAIDLPFAHGELNLRGRYRLGLALRRKGYDEVILLPNSLKSALVPMFAKIPKRTGWRGEARGLILNDMRRLDPALLPLMVQRFIALARPDGAALPEVLPKPALVTEQASVEQAMLAMSLDDRRPILAICPGAEFGDAKQWPAAHYASLSAEKINQGWQVWILGSVKDNAVALEIQGLLGADQREHCKALTGRTSLAQAIDLMSAASAVVSNDSGLMHVAAALGKPIVALYGSTSADFTPPLADQVQLLSIDIDCRPCFKRTCPLGHKRCLVDLSPALALEALEKIAPMGSEAILEKDSSLKDDELSAGEQQAFCES
jgi:heptosyltransferase-2